MPCQLKFIYSEKATKFCEISTVNLTGAIYRTNLRWRFHKNLWPSQNLSDVAKKHVLVGCEKA